MIFFMGLKIEEICCETDFFSHSLFSFDLFLFGGGLKIVENFFHRIMRKFVCSYQFFPLKFTLSLPYKLCIFQRHTSVSGIKGTEWKYWDRKYLCICFLSVSKAHHENFPRWIPYNLNEMKKENIFSLQA